jgi:hypothetical protein
MFVLKKVCKRCSSFKLVFIINKNFGNSIDNKEAGDYDLVSETSRAHYLKPALQHKVTCGHTLILFLEWLDSNEK